jgi:hypothetical protein
MKKTCKFYFYLVSDYANPNPPGPPLSFLKQDSSPSLATTSISPS